MMTHKIVLCIEHSRVNMYGNYYRIYSRVIEYISKLKQESLRITSQQVRNLLWNYHLINCLMISHLHRRHNCITKVFSPFSCLLQFIGIKGSIVAWFSNTPSKMVELSAAEIVGTMEPEQSWFHRWFPFLQWSPSSPQALMDAESELLSSKFSFRAKVVCGIFFSS